MEIKDLLPLFGIAIGWLLAEGSAYGKRAIERKRTVGKALAVLYFLFMEMVQVKMVQEKLKNLNNDVKEWERLRQKSFERYTSQDDKFIVLLNGTAESLGEYYPMEAYELLDVLKKHQFIKSKKLDVFTSNRERYLEALNTYELGQMTYQYQLELIIRFLAFHQSKLLWAKIRYQYWRMRRRVPQGDMVFLQQATRSKRRAAILDSSVEQEAAAPKGPTNEV